MFCLLFELLSLILADMVPSVHSYLQVVVGSEVVIDMMENATTGYTWKLFDESYVTGGYLSYISDFRVEIDGGEEITMGAPSIHRFVFRGEKSGSTHVLFVKVRFGEIDAPAVLESRFVVDVVEKPRMVQLVYAGEEGQPLSLNRFFKKGVPPTPIIRMRNPEQKSLQVVGEKQDTGMISPTLDHVIHPVHKPLQVVVGSEVTIDMMENPTTGYTWKLFDDGFTAGGVLSLVNDSMIKMEGDKEDMGTPSIHRFVFRGEKRGVVEVRLVQSHFERHALSVPESYFVHVKPDTGLISPSLTSDTGMIHPVHQPLQVVVGSEVVIDMIENPTTGYTWKLFDESYATGGYLSYISDFRVEIHGGEENKMGAPTIHRFVFRGEKSGSTHVLFVKVRFGVEVEAEAERYFVHVVEKPDIDIVGSN